MGRLKKMSWRAVALTVLGAALTMACEDPVETIPSYRLVHAVMHTGADSARLRLNRVNVNGRQTFGVGDARVTLATESGTLELQWHRGVLCLDTLFFPVVPTTGGCYMAELPTPVQAGARYSFTAELVGEPDITGETYVPMPPVLRLSEEPWIRFPLEHPFVPILMEYETEPAVGRVESYLTFAEAHERGGGWRTDQCTFENRSVALDPREEEVSEVRLTDLSCDFDWDSMAVQVVSASYDSAYAQYVEAAGPASQGGAQADLSAGVEGAFGLFGGATSVIDTIYIQRERPPN